MAGFPPVNEQMQILMRGVDFGDEQTYVNMERELRLRLQESLTRADRCACIVGMTRLLRICISAIRSVCGSYDSFRTLAMMSPF